MLKNFKKELLSIQKDLISVTNMGIVIIDIDGEYITEKTNYSEFCKVFRKNSTLSLFCEKCDLKALNKVLLSRTPYIYKCHSGLIDVIIPILYEGEIIGAFLIGQFLLENNQEFELEKILKENIGKNIDLKLLQEKYKELTVISLEKLESIIRIVTYSTYYIADCIKNKKWLEMKNTVSKVKIELSNSKIAPIIKYINEHINENVSLSLGANLCNMSQSQFSRTFKKETGKTFKEYILLKKIEQAKFYIKTTDKSFSEISDFLGFEDSSYFTKLFKKYEGITPKEYKIKILK
ncbi:PocR ligand-binding domain-containing protein [uncultured Fusobacterium sp.]|uniref:PocR ligand-binding domain-containing protein n=1 Tax=uncultured Fusobacterium sp. TaxID=159267 RepID=UPI0026006C22|nr:PocR ligand-binding domain-containing protein [uncultured Fusobacterium sp.]